MPVRRRLRRALRSAIKSMPPPPEDLLLFPELDAPPESNPDVTAAPIAAAGFSGVDTWTGSASDSLGTCHRQTHLAPVTLLP
jgi:hypothetical protein